jgi:hypothetical protein
MFAPSSTEVAPRTRGDERDPDRVCDSRSRRPWARGEPAAAGRQHYGGSRWVVQTDLTAKALEILKTAVPRARRQRLGSRARGSFRRRVSAKVVLG